MKIYRYLQHFPPLSLVVILISYLLWHDLGTEVGSDVTVVVPLLLVVPVSAVILDLYRMHALRANDQVKAHVCWFALRLLSSLFVAAWYITIRFVF